MNDDNPTICPMPFYYCEISSQGQVSPCCPAYCNCYTFGNLTEQSLDEVWNSAKATAFRSKILKGDYSLCNLDYCCIKDRKTRAEIEQNYYADGHIMPPQTLVVSYDKECNLACIMCRDEIIKNTANDEQRLKTIENNFFSHLKNCKTLYLSGLGDPFGSRYAKNLISKVCTLYPDIRFDFLTNGLLLTEKLFEKLHLANKIHSLRISIHAANKKTYKQITKHGNFDKLMLNLAFFAEKKRCGQIGALAYLFVVHDLNFREMPAFAHLAQSHGASVVFSVYRDQGRGPLSKDNHEHTVFMEGHPLYGDFLNVLKDAVLQAPWCEFDGLLEKARRAALQGPAVAAPAQSIPSVSVCPHNGDIFAGLNLRSYQQYLIKKCVAHHSFEGKKILELGSDLELQTAQGLLRCGAAEVWAVNPSFPTGLASPDSRITVIKNFGEQTALPDKSFDVIFGIALLEHVERLHEFATECKRLLKDDGLCYLQGNPLWTSARGHHTWLKDLPETNNSYYFSDTSSPYQSWEHLTLNTPEKVRAALVTKHIPEADIPILIHHLLEDAHISRHSPSHIAEAFRAVFGFRSVIKRGFSAHEPNVYFEQALEAFSEVDLLCEDMQITIDNSARGNRPFQCLPLIPLGYNAFTAHILHKIGIAEIENFSANSLPFDYAYMPFDSLNTLLQTNFEGMTQHLHFDSVCNYWKHTTLHMGFNHDRDCGPNSLARLQARLQRRVEQFRTHMRGDLPPIFIFSTYFLPDPQKCVEALLQNLRAIRGQAPFVLIVLGEPALQKPPLNQSVPHISLPFPCESLTSWWQPEQQASEKGLHFQAELKVRLTSVLATYCNLYSL